MLVVTANWAVTDGSLVSRPRGPQVEWLASVRRAAIRAGVQADGRYAPLERLDVVLAGDTFDALTSTAWLGRMRPWHAGRRAADVTDRVLVAAAARGRRLLGGLARWVRVGIDVPAADRRGRPDWARPLHVPVHVAVLPGDRDRRIAAALPRLARRGIRVAADWSSAGITVCHGAEIDPLWSGGGPPEPGHPTLGESLAVDLVTPFAAAVRGDAAWPEARGLVARLAAAPWEAWPGLVSAWVAAAQPPAARSVRDRWLGAVAGWRRAARIAEPSCAVACDPLDAAAAWLEGDGTSAAAAGEIAALCTAAVPPPTQGLVVLGHPPSGRSGGAVVCLGGPNAAATNEPRGDARVACVAARRGIGGPAHVVVSPSAGAAGWDWLELDADAATAGMPPAAAAARIIEAA